MDLKAVGYFVSTVGVFLLGMVAWQANDEPRWKAVAVAVGMATSIIGMGARFLSHRKDRHDLHRVERKAES